MTASVRARRRIAPLELVRLTPERRARGLFADLNRESESFPRAAAVRISLLEDLADLDQALQDVPREWYRIVETLALQAVAIRIAKIQPIHDTQAARVAALEQRRAELAKVPGDLRERVEAWVRSYYVTRPWLERPKNRVRE